MSAPQIQLARMGSLAEAVDKEDDWTGTTSADTRRKIQTRLNVRAYRRRRRAAEAEAHKSLVSASVTLDANSQRVIPCWVEDQQAVFVLQASAVHKPSVAGAQTLPYRDMVSDPAPAGVILPLSADHLIPLIQFNAVRGSLAIRLLLSPLISQPVDDCWTEGLRILPMPLDPCVIPPSLYPTALQSIVPHPQWIDTMLHPVMRDNFILAMGTFDEDDLWTDMCGAFFEGLPASEIELRGVMVWSTPWDVAGWELSEGFLRKWGWCLRGCGEDLLAATNKWRRLRGDDPLVFEIA